MNPGYVYNNRIITKATIESPYSDSDKMFGAVPYQRYGHTVVEYQGKAYVWGGRNDDYGACNLLHEYDPGVIYGFCVKINFKKR